MKPIWTAVHQPLVSAGAPYFSNEQTFSNNLEATAAERRRWQGLRIKEMLQSTTSINHDHNYKNINIL